MPPAVQARNPGVNINAQRVYQGYTSIGLYESTASSTYHGVQAGLTRRYAKDLTFSLAYTFSKVMTDASSETSGVENLLDYRSERARATFDRNHIFVASYVYHLPFLRRQRGVRGKLLGGWQLSGLVQAQAGQWLTPSISTATGTRRWSTRRGTSTGSYARSRPTA